MISAKNYHYLYRLAKRTKPFFKKKNRFTETMHREKNAEANGLISEYLKTGKPFLIGRLGSVESRFILNYYLSQNISSDFEGIYKTLAGQINRFWKRENALLEQLCLNAGFFPKDEKLTQRFVEVYENAIKQLDILGIWNEMEEFMEIPDETVLCKIRELEPWFYENPWSNHLKGKKVLVVHPFESDIRNQYNQRKNLYSNPNILPEFELKTIKAVQTIAGQKSEFETCFNALDFMKEKISQTDFDVAIIGAGAYGLPLAAYVKDLGKQAVHLGGVTQLLFGIKGKRWEDWTHYTELRKENGKYWVYPSDENQPRDFKKIEGGAYWY